MGELPYPPFKAPLIADNSYIPHRLSRLDSYKALESFMRESGTTETLLDIGHAWFWHQEVFQWLFLERVILQAKGPAFDQLAFDRVYSLAQTELAKPNFLFRQVTMINGAPMLNRRIRISSSIRLEPTELRTAHYRLADLLDLRSQGGNRPVPTMVFLDGCFLEQDHLVRKGSRN